MAEELERSRRLIANIQREQLREAILEVLPQGHGSGLDADMVDGLHAIDIIDKARVALVLSSSGSGGAGGGVTDHGALTGLEDDDHPQYLLADGSRGVSGNFLPVTDGAHSLGDDVKRWSEALFYYLNEGSGVWAELRAGAKIYSDDPDFPGEAVPHIDFVPLAGIGFDEFRIGVDPTDFMFAIMRREYGAGSWLNIMKHGISPVSGNTAWLFGADFLPTTTNAYDFGADQYRWRDLFLYRYLAIFGFASTLPSPSMLTLNRVTARTPASGATELYFCRRRTANDYKWKNLSDSFESVAILKDVAGITKTDIGTTVTEILGFAHRSKVDLTYMDCCRVVFGGQNSEATTFYCKIQYSTDQVTWYDLTPEAASDGTANEQPIIGSWSNVPTGALTDVYVRAVGRAANATSDPTYKSIELQVR